MIPYFIIRGLPGVGKSTLVDMCNILPVIDPDLINDESLDVLSSTKRANVKYKQNLDTALKMINSGNSFYWVQPWSKKWGIEITIDNIYKIGNSSAFPIIITIEADPAECYRRYCARKQHSRKITFKEYFLKYVQNFDKPKYVDQNSIVIDNSDRLKASAELLKYVQSYIN